MRTSRKLAVLAGGVQEMLPFTYTGTYEFIKESSVNWRIRFLTDGTFTPGEAVSVDVFAVGGGGSSENLSGHSGCGGGGGYTKTKNNVSLIANVSYAVVIGAGGGTGGSPSDGGVSRFYDELITGEVFVNAPGGKKAGSEVVNDQIFYYAGDGGSGGGGRGTNSQQPGNGGSDGGDGGIGAAFRTGHGQRTTTREFKDESGTLYAGGGGGKYRTTVGTGGAGGGGDGGQPGQANTGGGGGGCSTGGTGIVIIRNTR